MRFCVLRPGLVRGRVRSATTVKHVVNGQISAEEGREGSSGKRAYDRSIEVFRKLVRTHDLNDLVISINGSKI